MARRFFKRFTPPRERVTGNRLLRIFGRALHQPNLWHLNRRSVSRAMLVGLFWTLIPMPFQTIPATACALMLRANLGITLLLVWLTNPLTLPPVLYACYRFGRFLLRSPASELAFEWSWKSIRDHMSEIWRPLYAGALVAAIVSSILGYVLVEVIWRLHVARRWANRAQSA